MSAEQQSLELPDIPGIGEGWDLVQSRDEGDTPAYNGCTGERLERIKERRAAIVAATAIGVGVKRCAEMFKVSPQVVRAIRVDAWRTGELDPLKERLGREYLAVADLLRAQALERIDEIPAHVLLLASAQSADKGLLLTGSPTSRVEHVSAPKHAELNDWIDSLEPLQPVAAREIPADKGEAAMGGEAACASAQVVPLGGSSESLSLVSCPTSEGESDGRAENGRIEGKNGGAE